MRILFLGGTGLISTACTELAVSQGHDVTLLTRGRTAHLPVPDGVRRLTADVYDEQSVRSAVAGSSYDVIVQWLGFTPAHVAQDLRVFADQLAGGAHYVFISSASAYEKPPSHWLVREGVTPLANPHWQYSRDKIACEELLRGRDDVRWTIVRPTLTYGPTQIPVCVGSWDKPFTIVDRMRRGRPILVPGDGTALWTLTHNSDFARGFVGLLGNQAAYGEDVHVTSDEALTWNQIYGAVADAAGVAIDVLHVPTDGLVAAMPEEEGNLWGDKVHSTVFDLTKLRRLVPGFAARVPFAEGIRETVAWFDADPAWQAVDADLDARWDRLADVYARALVDAAALAPR